MSKSPLRYPGGKSRAVKFLDQYIPEYKELREVFFGGGSLSFYCIQKFADKKYLASDLNYELYCFWSQLKDNSVELIRSVQHIYDTVDNGKELFNKIIAWRNDELTELQRAVDFFVLNRITFSGVVDSGGYSQGSFDARFTQSAIERLKDATTIVEKIEFYCEDFSYLVAKPGKSVFLFLDPPYHAATKSKLYGKNGILHTSFNHQQLFESLKNCPHKWLITYDSSEYIKNLYKDFYQVDWQLQYGMTNSGNNPSVLGQELLIANYDLNQIASLNNGKQQKVTAAGL